MREQNMATDTGSIGDYTTKEKLEIASPNMPNEIELKDLQAQGPTNVMSKAPHEDAPHGYSVDQAKIEETNRFTFLDATFVIGGMFLYIADLVTDLLVGVQYLRQGDILWSVMTFVFVFVPSLVLQYFSFRWFLLDLNKDKDYQSKTFYRKLWAWCQWLATHVLQVGAIKRYWNTLKFGILSREDNKYYQRMVVERLDITMLRLLEAFLESAPQLVLQVYIMVEREELYWLTAASAIVSLSSLAFSLGIYHKALRDFLEDKAKIPYSGVALHIVWRLFTITARVLAMALFASIFEWWVFVLVGAHWAIMTGWLIWQKTEFHKSKYDEIPFDAVIGTIHIFCFFNMKEGRTRWRAIIFYTIIFIENTIMFGLWYREQDSREKMYGLPALLFVWGGFFIGIFFMLFYYRFCHPTGKKLPLCFCGDTPTSDITVQNPPTEDVGNERGVGVDEPDGAIETNVGGTDLVASRRLIERDRYRYLFSYEWRRRIHPKQVPSAANNTPQNI